MNLHITGDDKFIDFFIEDIKKMKLITSNDFLVYASDGNALKYVKSKEIHKITLNSAEWNEFFKEKIQKYDRVFIHYFEGLLYDIVQHIPAKAKVIWCFYGNDGFLYFPENYFFQKLTRKLSMEISGKRNRLFVNLLYPLFLLNRRVFLAKRRAVMRAAFKRVDYFANYLISDYYLIKNKAGFRARHIEITLASLEVMISMESYINDNHTTSLRNSILIGNSATMTNNHFDVFEQLRTQDIKGKKIYCPLSYGDEKYAGIVKQKGLETFGENFIPLINFMPLTEYNAILKECGYVFMNHDRTQGAGNIIVSLYNGAKVFLSNQSGIYHFMIKLGVKVFSVQDDIAFQKNIFIPLSKEEIALNQKLIYNYFNQHSHEERLLKVLNV